MSSYSNLMSNFIALFKECRGAQNKIRFLEYTAKNALNRLFECFQDHDDILIEFNEAKVWFGFRSGELSSYIEIYLRKDYEQIPEFIPNEDDIVFDIGANIGLYCIRQAKRVKNGKVFAFEPNPFAFKRLLKNLKANCLQNVIAFNIALYSKPCELDLSFPRFSTGTTRVMLTHNDNLSSTIKVKATTLDDFILREGIERIDLMKVDVEGSELGVLKGGKRSLRLVKKIVMECHSDELRKQVKEFLCNNGFREVLTIGKSPIFLVYFINERTRV